MTVALLLANLVVATISMIFNVAYILHELGWFPHGKPRKEAVALVGSPLAGQESIARDAVSASEAVRMDNPFSMALRRYAHADVYETDDPVAKLREVLQRAEAEPTASRFDDLINLANVLTSSEEPSPELRAVVGQALDFIQAAEVQGAKGQE